MFFSGRTKKGPYRCTRGLRMGKSYQSRHLPTGFGQQPSGLRLGCALMHIYLGWGGSFKYLTCQPRC